MKQAEYRPDINGLRAIAVGSVVLFHANRHVLSGGFAGVDIFFVISGYLISRIILTDLEHQCFSFADFYLKRIKRIFPALLLVMACTYIAGFVLMDPPDLENLGLNVRDGALFISNLRQMQEGGYFDAPGEYKPLLHLWSLSIEEQYYILCPAVLALVFRRRAWIPALIGMVIVTSFAINLYMVQKWPIAAFYLPWGRAWELALGAGLSWYQLRGGVPVLDSGIKRNVANLAGLGAIAWSFVLLEDGMAYPGTYALVPTLGTLLVLASPTAFASRAILQSRILVFFGMISYPLYLWHWPLLALAHYCQPHGLSAGVVTSLMALAVVLATLTWLMLEKPAANLFVRQRWPVATALAAMMVAMLGLGQLTYVQLGFNARYPENIRASFALAGADMAGLYRGGICFQYDYLEKDFTKTRAMFERNQCSTPADPSKPVVMLVGESHAAHLYPGLVGQMGDEINLLQLNIVRCLPGVEENAALSSRCQAANHYIFERIRAVKPDVLVVGANYFAYVADPHFVTAKYADWLEADMKKLHSEGIRHIVIIGQVPAWREPLSLLIAHQMLAQGLKDGAQLPEFTFTGLDQESLTLDRSMAVRDWGAGITYVSLADRLCTAQGCRQRIGPNLPDDLIAVDRGHFTANASAYVARTILVPALRRELSQQTAQP